MLTSEQLIRRRLWESKYRKKNRHKLAENQRRFNQTAKGRARFKRYELSDKAKARTARYNNTDKAKARYKRFRLNNPERSLAIARRYRKLHPERVRAFKKRWRDNNPAKCKAQGKRSREAVKRDPVRLQRKRQHLSKWYNAKWKTDPIFRLKNSLRLRLRQAIKERTSDQRALQLLGCELEAFKVYFESLFTSGMSWEHVFSGAIHIDHKLPIASFDLTKSENVKKCFHFSNLQPLWAEDNLAKADSYESVL